ncbi:hypothetical protein PHYBOEH_004791 [Phytophthora boehmeriae]|uniref:Uncharacterized protein n=1 Tax=Phytophthora boehmeriae TaxID=109152 RepID=A0A8T1WSH7_9STRA|nr:hypothetical protein PHYBOEH_004791 [Phytophthora boehmeriae]
MDRLPRVMLVEKVAKQQLAIENSLRREGFQWDLASSGEQAVSNFTRQPISAGASIGGIATNYELVVISDLLSDDEFRIIGRCVGSKERLKQKNGPPMLMCVVISAPGSDIPFSKAMCAACRRAQGRRVSQELAASTERGAREPPPMACPHCSLIVPPSAKTTLLSPVLAEMAQVIVYKHVKAATLHRLAEMWAAGDKPATNNSAPPSRGGRRNYGDSHLGLTPASFFAEVDKQLAAAKRGAFFPDHQTPEMALSTNDTMVAKRFSSSNTPTPTAVSVLRLDQVRSASA